ncbi:recombination protein NinB, partial [Clavibacter michiganensis]|uniref:recombination protein NinB n=1 Tax=Clavibacter michiganensis TaxID=28447 RepID=UPI00292E3AFF
MNTRAVVAIQSEADRARVAKWAQNVEVGTIVEFRKKTRSNEQNAKLHAMLGEVAEQVVWYGRKLDSDDWKNLFTASLRVADVVPGIDRGTIVPLGIRTSSMTIEEMGNLITLIYAFGDTQTPP